MKRLLFTALLFSSALAIEAQVPAVSEAVCANCEARTTRGEKHKRGCPAYEEEENEETLNSRYYNFKFLQEEDPLRYVTDKFNAGLVDGKTCPECGKDNHKDTNCGIASLQKTCDSLHNRYLASSKRKEWKPIGKKWTMAAGNLANRFEYYKKNPVKPSTKLKDYEPVRDQKPSEPLRPQMTPMAQPELHNSIQVAGVQETSGPNDPTVYDKRIEFKSYYEYNKGMLAVARGRTNQYGEAEWVLFKKDGTKIAGPFSKLYVTDIGIDNYFVAANAKDGLWGIYDKYGKMVTQHYFEDIQPLTLMYFATRFATGEQVISFKCQLNGKWGMIEAGEENKPHLPFIYDNIQVYDKDPTRVLVERDGLCGLVWRGGSIMVPVEYRYIEQVSIQKAGKYYIVSKDGVHYGAYKLGTLDFNLEYSLNEIRQKINEDAAHRIKLQEKR